MHKAWVCTSRRQDENPEPWVGGSVCYSTRLDSPPLSVAEAQLEAGADEDSGGDDDDVDMLDEQDWDELVIEEDDDDVWHRYLLSL